MFPPGLGELLLHISYGVSEFVPIKALKWQKMKKIQIWHQDSVLLWMIQLEASYSLLPSSSSEQPLKKALLDPFLFRKTYECSV